MKHYKSVNILSNFQNVKSACANLNPLFKTFCFYTLHLFTRQFSCVRSLPVWKSNKHANRQPNSYNHLDAFHVMCFARVHRCAGVHIFGDAKNVCPNFILFFPNNVQTESLNARTKTYHCKQIKVSACLITNRQISTINQFVCWVAFL